MTENEFRSHFSPFQRNTQLFILFTKWLPAAILDDRKSLSIAFLAISDQCATYFFFTKWLPFLAISDQYATFILFTKWLPAAILDDRKSLSIGFLPISDQYTTFIFFEIFFKMAVRPAAFLEVRFAPKTIGFFHYVLSMARPNMKLIGEFVTPLEMPQAFWAFLYKMAARGHFVFPIDDKNHRVLVIWDLNGYGEYEFNWCICDKVMPVQALACGGGGDGGGDGDGDGGCATKNIISPKFSNFGDIITLRTAWRFLDLRRDTLTLSAKNPM